MQALMIIIAILIGIIIIGGITSDEPVQSQKPRRRRRKSLFDVNPSSGPYKRLLRKMHGKDR